MICESTWEEINRVLVGWAAQEKLEKGKKIRIYSTATESDIHHPTDSGLLYDVVRTLSRLLNQLKWRQAKLELEGRSARPIIFPITPAGLG